jgi:PKD repeat protein
MLPVPLYPTKLDTVSTLYTAHDSLRVTLVEDYLPGRTSISVDGNLSAWPPDGIITLTEQRSDIDHRAISFFYTSRSGSEFFGLQLYPGFEDVAKPKGITHVTQNVVAPHHNNLKDALIAIEEFIGIKGTVDPKPLGSTMEGRINFLRKLVLRPRAWFSANRRVGIVPLSVEFRNLSFRDPIESTWDFGDGSSNSCSVISMSTPSTISTLVIEDATSVISKTYYKPGIYDVKLKVSNEFGDDTITIPNYITVRVAAPDPAVIEFAPDNATQSIINNTLYTRSNSIVNVAITDTGEQVCDPVTDYVWDMQDDLLHSNTQQAKASYSIGGIYDVRLRIGTSLGAYRNTIFKNSINVIEKNNLWYMVSPDTSNNITKNFYGYEFGLLSESFKLGTRNPLSVTRDYTQVAAGPNGEVAKKEFLRNNGFVRKNSTGSGDKGTALAYWSQGGSPMKIKFKEYQGFTDAWTTPVGLDTYTRGWNWIGLNANSKVYFLLGSGSNLATNTPGNSPTNQTRDVLNLNTYSFGDQSTFGDANYKNGADELQQNVGLGTHGDFSVYRSCWKDHTGFIVRNDGSGSYYRLKSFYRTEGTLTEEFQYIRKLPDMPGSMKLNGQLVPLNGGIYFFSNSGEFVVWNDVTSVWAVGSPSATSNPFRSLQDQTVSTFDNPENSLVATGDGDRRAFLSFDYSTKAFIKFNEATLSFNSLGSRPAGEQFLMGVY